LKTSSQDQQQADQQLQKLQEGYRSFVINPESRLRDIGNYCLGLIQSIRTDYVSAMHFFSLVTDSNLKYLNNSIGFIYLQWQEYQKAARFFQREIDNQGNLKGAYVNLSQLYFVSKNYPALEDLSKNETAYENFSFFLKRFLAIYELNFSRYYYLLVTPIWNNLNFAGTLAAIFIALVWFFYLRKLDFFEPEKYRYLLLCLVLGMFFSLLCYPLYDFYHFHLNFQLNGQWFNDLMYCIFGIGFIEELVKIVPLLLMIRFTRQLNESIDYLIYASISALGFATTENLLYFDELSLSVVHGRALTAVVLHLSLTSLIAYSLVFSRFQAKKKSYRSAFMFTFLLAMVFHGLYDYFLLGQGIIESLSVISIVILLFLAQVYSKILTNSLNQSAFFDEVKLLHFKSLTFYLMYAFSGIILLEYVLISISFSASYANQHLVYTGLTSYLIIIYLTIALGKFRIERSRWKKVLLVGM
jgi:RsiW-degrading membrane proteinase PrsW (M82 family)